MGLKATTAAADQPVVWHVGTVHSPIAGTTSNNQNILNINESFIRTHLHSVNKEDMTRLQLNCKVSCGDKSQLLGPMILPSDSYNPSDLPGA
jgi:hypothetical protein